jgi:hypothetical protein
MYLEFDIDPEIFHERKRRRILEMNSRELPPFKTAPTSQPGVPKIATFLPGRCEFEHEVDDEDLVGLGEGFGIWRCVRQWRTTFLWLSLKDSHLYMESLAPQSDIMEIVTPSLMDDYPPPYLSTPQDSTLDTPFYHSLDDSHMLTSPDCAPLFPIASRIAMSAASSASANSSSTTINSSTATTSMMLYCVANTYLWTMTMCHQQLRIGDI